MYYVWLRLFSIFWYMYVFFVQNFTFFECVCLCVYFVLKQHQYVLCACMCIVCFNIYSFTTIIQHNHALFVCVSSCACGQRWLSVTVQLWPWTANIEAGEVAMVIIKVGALQREQCIKCSVCWEFSHCRIVSYWPWSPSLVFKKNISEFLTWSVELVLLL